jgi:hypothetical protein
MIKFYQAVLPRFKFRKPAIYAVTALALLLGVVSSMSIAGAFSWVPTITLAHNGFYTVQFDASLRARPTDGVGFVLGEGGNGGQSLLLTSSTNPALDLDVNNAGDTTGSMRNNLNFGPDGSGYFVWRHHPAGYQAWLRKMNPDGSLSNVPADLGTLYRNAGGTKEIDLPDVAVSPLTNKVYVTGQVVTGPSTMGFGEYNPATNTVSNVVNTLPANNGGEMKARICVDTSQGRDDIHIAGWFNFDLYVVDRINGVWTVSPALTSSAAAQFQFGQSLAIACASDGYAYAVYDSINADNTGYSTGLVRYTPGVGWAQVNRNPGHSFGGYDAYGPAYSNTWICGIPGTGGAGVAVTPDNKVWVSSGVRCGGYTGQVVASFSNHGDTLDTFDVAIPFQATSKKAQIDYGAPTGRMYAASQYQSPAPNSTLLSYTTLSVSPSNFVATAINYKRIDLSWTFPSPGSFTNVQLERSTDNANWSVIAQLPVSQLTYSDNNLASPNTTYYYRLKGYNTTTSSTYVTTSATTLSIPTPANFAATAVSFKQINLNWTYPSPVDLTNVQLERSTDNVNWSIVANLPITQTSYSDNNLASPGTLYYYRLKGYNATVSSAYVTSAATTVPAFYLSFDKGPGQVEPGSAFGIAPVISVRDPFKNIVTNYTGSITLTVTAGPSGYNFGGTKTLAVTNGVADFSSAGLTLDKIGVYTLQATAPNIPSGTLTGTAGVEVRANLIFTSSPTNPLVNGQFSATVQVQRPSDNSVVTNYSGTITLTIRPGTGTPGAKINGGSSITGTVTNGVATFTNNIVIDRYGGGYQLKAASSDPLNVGFSNIFSVVATPSFAATPTNPATPTSNSSFSVVVTVQDAASNTLTSYNGPVTLSANSGTLLGIPTVNAVNGVATFNNLAFSNNGTFTLHAALPFGTTADSSNITVNSPSSCQSLVVNTTSTTGDDAGTNCTTITLPGAIGRATSGDVIRFAPNVQGGTINLGAGPVALPSGVSLEGGCNNTGPRVTITVTGASTFQVGPNSNIWGIALSNLKLSLPGTAKGNKFSCFVAAP